MDIRPTSNAAAAAKIGNPPGCLLVGACRRCSSVRERCGYPPSSRLASCPPANSAPASHFDMGSKSETKHPLMKNKKYQIAKTMAAAVLVAASWHASGQSADAIVNKLVQKGVLTQDEANDLRKEADK